MGGGVNPPPLTGRYVALFYFLLACGALAKGPVIFLHVGVAITAFTWCFRRWPKTPWVSHLGGMLLFAPLALPWPLYIISHVPGAVQIWRFESIGEFSDNQRDARPFWYYLPQLILISLPWTAFAVAGVIAAVQRRKRQRLFPLIWVSVTLVIFSMSHMKKNAYLLPMMSGIVVVVADQVARLEAATRRRPGVDRRWREFHIIASFGLAIAICVATAREHIGILLTVGVCLASLAVAGFAGIMTWAAKRTRDWLHVQATAFAVLACIFIAFPQAARHDRRATSSSSDGTVCGGCRRGLFNYNGNLNQCPNCGTLFCDDCMAKIQAVEGQPCPACQVKNAQRPPLPRPRTFG